MKGRREEVGQESERHKAQHMLYFKWINSVFRSFVEEEALQDITHGEGESPE